MFVFLAVVKLATYQSEISTKRSDELLSTCKKFYTESIEEVKSYSNDYCFQNKAFSLDKIADEVSTVIYKKQSLLEISNIGNIASSDDTSAPEDNLCEKLKKHNNSVERQVFEISKICIPLLKNLESHSKHLEGLKKPVDKSEIAKVQENYYTSLENMIECIGEVKKLEQTLENTELYLNNSPGTPGSDGVCSSYGSGCGYVSEDAGSAESDYEDRTSSCEQSHTTENPPVHHFSENMEDFEKELEQKAQKLDLKDVPNNSAVDSSGSGDLNDKCTSVGSKFDPRNATVQIDHLEEIYHDTIQKFTRRTLKAPNKQQ